MRHQHSSLMLTVPLNYQQTLHEVTHGAVAPWTPTILQRLRARTFFSFSLLDNFIPYPIPYALHCLVLVSVNLTYVASPFLVVWYCQLVDG